MKVLKVTENKDGSLAIDYELTSLEKDKIKNILGIKRLTKKRINEFVVRAILEYYKKNK